MGRVALCWCSFHPPAAEPCPCATHGHWHGRENCGCCKSPGTGTGLGTMASREGQGARVGWEDSGGRAPMGREPRGDAGTPRLPYRGLGGRQRGDAAAVVVRPRGAGGGRRGALLPVGTWGHSGVSLARGRALSPPHVLVWVRGCHGSQLVQGWGRGWRRAPGPRRPLLGARGGAALARHRDSGRPDLGQRGTQLAGGAAFGGEARAGSLPRYPRGTGTRGRIRFILKAVSEALRVTLQAQLLPPGCAGGAPSLRDGRAAG